MQQKFLQLYARFLVQSGAAVRRGQNFVITAPVGAAAFARLCAEEGYAAGAKEVVIHYTDEQFACIQLQHTDIQVLEEVKPWLLARYMDYAANDGDDMATLRILANDPEIFKGLDPEKLNRVSAAGSKASKPFQEMTMNNKVQWCIGAIPSAPWAAKIFPGEEQSVAVEKLWDAIFDVCRVKGGDPVEEWKRHTDALHSYVAWLNSIELESICLQSANGTNLTVGLADGHVWQGGGDVSRGGTFFLPNIPTEEVFTAPHRERTEGVVKSSMPYVYNGNLIKGITARFEKGVVVECAAEEGNDLLQRMLSVDEGARHIGEIALVPASSPIRQSGLLFYNTLFDENAACHIAFGAGYPGTVEGGDAMTRTQLLAQGVNDSLVHEDVMVGTVDMDITGRTKSGQTVQIFKNGEWAR